MLNILLVILAGYMVRLIGKNTVVHYVYKIKPNDEIKSYPGFHVGVVSYVLGSTILYLGITVLCAYSIYKYIL